MPDAQRPQRVSASPAVIVLEMRGVSRSAGAGGTWLAPRRSSPGTATVMDRWVVKCPGAAPAVVNVTLPSITAALGGGITGLQWVGDGYTLLFAALLLS